MDKISEIMREVTRGIEADKLALEAQREELAAAKRAWEDLSNKLSNTHFPPRIILNIGGTLFTTTLSTLTSIKNTYFDAMFSGRFPLQAGDDGSYFIDRDPLVFRHILNYMRGQPVVFDTLTKQERIQIAEDASFYNIVGLIQNTQQDAKAEQEDHFELKWKKGPHYTVSNNNKTITKISATGWNCTAIAKLKNDCSFFKWGIQITKSSNSYIMIGVAPSSINQAQVSDTRGGWYLYLNNGTLYSSNGSGSAYYGARIKEGSTVVVSLNKTKGELSYEVDGKDLGVAFKNIPSELPLVACVLLSVGGNSVEIINV